jgi:Protein of unknown function (DUF1579)
LFACDLADKRATAGRFTLAAPSLIRSRQIGQLRLDVSARPGQKSGTMKLRPTLLARLCLGIAVVTSIAAVSAQDEKDSSSPASSPVSASASSSSSATTSSTTATGGSGSASAMPNDAEMMKTMMDMAKLNDNHKLLTSLDGTWNFTTKMWMDGNTSAKPQESKGTAVRKSMMGGRYVVMDITGKMKMPGDDGKLKDFEFKGQGIDAYDNAKQKFVSSWVDNMSTGIMTSEGTYDPATKTLTYTGEYQMAHGMKEQIRQLVKLTDKDHMLFEWYENRGGNELKTMEIAYTRAGKSK